jgi:hypothetical protein
MCELILMKQTLNDTKFLKVLWDKFWGSVVRFQMWWSPEHGANATLNARTIINCHQKLMTTGCVTDRKRSGWPSTSWTPENIATVWCGITATTFVGPFVLRGTVNAARYRKMLQDRMWPVISQWENIATLHFMQDGAPPHFANTVHTWLHCHFPGRWIGRRGVHERPPRSPDLTPCDFLLCVCGGGGGKEQVYRRKPRNLEQLEEIITNVLSNISEHMLQSAVANVPGRLRKCGENAGAHVEF